MSQYIPMSTFKDNLATYFPTFFKNGKETKETNPEEIAMEKRREEIRNNNTPTS